MSNKKIEAWKVQVAKGKSVFVASNVMSIHPVVDRIVSNLCKINLIKYVGVSVQVSGRVGAIAYPGHLYETTSFITKI